MSVNILNQHGSLTPEQLKNLMSEFKNVEVIGKFNPSIGHPETDKALPEKAIELLGEFTNQETFWMPPEKPALATAVLTAFFGRFGSWPTLLYFNGISPKLMVVELEKIDTTPDFSARGDPVRDEELVLNLGPALTDSHIDEIDRILCPKPLQQLRIRHSPFTDGALYHSPKSLVKNIQMAVEGFRIEPADWDQRMPQIYLVPPLHTPTGLIALKVINDLSRSFPKIIYRKDVTSTLEVINLRDLVRQGRELRKTA